MGAGAEAEGNAFLAKSAPQQKEGPQDAPTGGASGAQSVPFSPYGQHTPWQTQHPPRRDGRAAVPDSRLSAPGQNGNGCILNGGGGFQVQPPSQPPQVECEAAMEDTYMLKICSSPHIPGYTNLHLLSKSCRLQHVEGKFYQEPFNR